ncbi:hypothetical protein Tco_1322331, partial [Tanacetum coccineum]
QTSNQKEATFQVVLDALALTPFYQAFLITADVPAIYMQEFWATISVQKSSIRFTIIKKKVSLDVDIDLRHTGDITYVTDVNVDYLHQPWRAFATVINKCLSGKETRIDKIRLSRAQILWATNGTRLKTKAKVAKSDKKKQPAKKPKSKGLAVLSEFALTEAEQLKLATKRRKTQFHSSHASGSGDEVDTQSKVPDEQHLEMTGAYEGTGNIPGVPGVPIYEFESDDDNDGNNGNDGDDDDANDDDKQEGDDTNEDDEETDSDSTQSDIIKIPILNQSTTGYYEEEEEKIYDEETMYDDEDDEVTKELYEDVNVNLGYEDTEMTNVDQGASEQKNKADELVQSSSVSSNFTSKLLNFENPSPTDNEITSLMGNSALHAMEVPKITSSFTTTIPPPPLFFNPLPQQATPTSTPTTSEATTSFPSLMDFSSTFRFNDRVTNLEKDLLEIKQVDQYAQSLSSILAIVDRYMDNKLREAINNLDCRQEAQEEKNAYIELVDTSMRALIKE